VCLVRKDYSKLVCSNCEARKRKCSIKEDVRNDKAKEEAKGAAELGACMGLTTQHVEAASVERAVDELKQMVDANFAKISERLDAVERRVGMWAGDDQIEDIDGRDGYGEVQQHGVGQNTVDDAKVVEGDGHAAEQEGREEDIHYEVAGNDVPGGYLIALYAGGGENFGEDAEEIEGASNWADQAGGDSGNSGEVAEVDHFAWLEDEEGVGGGEEPSEVDQATVTGSGASPMDALMKAVWS